MSPTLICIPDISGFTKFMSDVDISLTSKVIPSLLNNIIYANKLDLKVSEIEGDAVLFYRTGELPPFEDLINQMRLFYTRFYEQLEVLGKRFSHKINGDDIPERLGLKIVLHYGKSVGSVAIGSRIKLMGEDVIIAHRLLKNNIPIDEYLLLSDTLLDEYKDEKIYANFDWGRLIKEEEAYKHIGEIGYSYVNLTPLVD
ncbi:DUF2652 domain-containing protein [uncultured Winogradskyella sp.]|uniref:DUF2652 domain-containing protein n=1 Tax=uncultured Winogradskyella sp. TaxID=395353 RepID=UPI00260F0032|nr:DUF2652 domain-containing protein [uncultured Winogradskyella sp.]